MTALAESPARVAPAPAPVRRAAGSTPARLVALLALIAVSTGLLFVALSVAISDTRSSQDTIGHVDGPTIIAAQKISFSLADMDSSLANYLLVGARNDLGETRGAAVTEFDADRAVVIDQLVLLSSEFPNSAGQQIIHGLIDGIASYQGEVSDAEQSADNGQAAPALAAYRLATGEMHNTLIPAAAQLNTSNLRDLDATYADSRSRASRDILLIVVAGVLCLAALGVTQLFVTRRSRRLVNPSLAVATLLALGLTIAGSLVIAHGRGDLHGVKQDSFDSVVALSEARSVISDANADESRFIIDPANTPQYQAEYLAKSLQIVGLPADTTIADFDARLAPEVTAAEAGRIEFTGALGVELNNITFPGERAAALSALTTFQTYELDDRVLRSLVNTGQHDAAVRYDTGAAADQSDGAFNALDAALQKVLGINATYFGTDVAQTDHNLTGWSWLPAISALLVLGLAAGGVGIRLKEYRA